VTLKIHQSKSKKRRNGNCTKVQRSSKILGPPSYHGQNQFGTRRVKCIMCNVRNALLWKENKSCSKLDNLLKNKGHKKSTILVLKVDANTFYFNKIHHMLGFDRFVKILKNQQKW
jgi:hypothetical protein